MDRRSFLKNAMIVSVAAGVANTATAAERYFPTKVDQSLFARPAVRQALASTVLEALHHGPQGAQLDMALMVEPWDFRPEDISISISMWYGLVDQSTSPAMGRYLAKVIPGSVSQFFPDEGHLSLLNHHSETILSALTH